MTAGALGALVTILLASSMSTAASDGTTTSTTTNTSTTLVNEDVEPSGAGVMVPEPVVPTTVPAPDGGGQ